MNSNKHLKKVMIIIVSCLTLLLCGCTKGSITYQLKEDHEVIVTYEATIDISQADDDLKKGLKALCEKTVAHYQSLGFKTNYTVDDTKIQISMIYSHENPDQQSAYEDLKALMDDTDISFLLGSDLSCLITKNQHAITIDATIDLNEMLDAFGLYQLPKVVKDDLVASLNESELTLNFILPATTITDKGNEVAVSTQGRTTTITQKIKLDEATNFSVKGYTIYDDDKAVALSYDEMIAQTKSNINTLKIAQYALIIIALAGSAVLIIDHYKKKRDPNH